MRNHMELRLNGADIIFQELGKGQGKLIVSGENEHNYSYYWGSMGAETLKEFIKGIGVDYFVGNMLPITDRGEFDSKETMKSIRKYIKEELSYELPWYKFMSAQKELREKLKEMEGCISDEREFVDVMNDFSSSLYCDELSLSEEKEFKDIISGLECEPWHFIVKGDSRDSTYLKQLHKDLQKALKKPFNKTSL